MSDADPSEQMLLDAIIKDKCERTISAVQEGRVLSDPGILPETQLELVVRTEILRPLQKYIPVQRKKRKMFGEIVYTHARAQLLAQTSTQQWLRARLEESLQTQDQTQDQTQVRSEFKALQKRFEALKRQKELVELREKVTDLERKLRESDETGPAVVPPPPVFNPAEDSVPNPISKRPRGPEKSH